MMDSSDFKPLPGDAATPAEFRRVVLTVACAIANPRMHSYFKKCLYLIKDGSDRTEWDVTRLADKVKNTRALDDGKSALDDLKLAKHFKNPELGHLDEPATILDRYGRIMVWHLPGIFVSSRIVRRYPELPVDH